MENRKLDSIIRLSNLPDSVLSHILSFFPTKLSIRTSILARRWRYLWSYVPALYFDSEYDDEEFIERVSSLHKPKTINTFRLYLKDVHNGIEPQIKAWIASAIKRNVQSVDLFFTCFDNLLHQSLFTSKTLVDLKISSSSFIPVVVTPLAVCLPRLKKIHLSPVLYAGGTSLSDLLSSCPALEEVVIRLIIKCSSRPFTISSPTIKRLTVRFQLTQINTPALRYLNVVDYLSVSEDIKSWIEPPQVPKCLSSHLRTIRLVEIVGTKHEFEIVRYLLKNAKVLERMEIIYVLEQIDLLERRSEACELEFVEIF
ncbi:hypothetical protein MIMGU_mgv1a018954mg [Erythranthe guttata]|uniref:F-box domain-containing protein n=1 Tax=Erythranthe guttata TaxID=4155 RepID=A0A022RWJ8_ERYGU|nr:hypothetical protein MIMGU_mgv1a018954mg [Erythranthe guttata]